MSIAKSVTFVRDSNPNEVRSLMFPELVTDYLDQGIQVFCEAGIGQGYGIHDLQFEQAGAVVLSAKDAWAKASLIAKYKPPTPDDVARMPFGCSYASYLHLEDNRALANALCDQGIRSFAFEFIEEPLGEFPVTRAHSEIAGKMAVIYGAYHLQSHLGGNGVFLPRIPDATPAKVLVIGYGNSGAAAATTAAALGADVTVLGRNRSRLRAFSALMPGNVTCLINEGDVLGQLLPSVDLVVGAILISTRETPAMITTDMVKTMRKGSMIVDVTCGYGPGYLETFDQETSLEAPVCSRFGVLHCKIDKLPGGVHRSSAQALSRLCAPYLCRLASVHNHLTIDDRALAKAEVTRDGAVSSEYVASMLKKCG
ncbi:MAG: NAD(P)-dependent oxidoreductase [Pseudomonadota bacterium]